MNRIKPTFAILLFFGTAFFTSCNEADKSKVEATATDTSKTAAVGSATLKNSNEQAALDTYLLLKDNLVAADSIAVQKNANNLTDQLKAANWTDATDEAEKMGSTQSLKSQREIFTQLSNNLIAALEKTEFSSGNAYIQHCPMANNGNGGDWVSLEKEIRNPYYGSQMMKCGAVEKTLGVK